MVNKSDTIYNEARNNLRVKEKRSIYWRANDGDIKGKGQIRNISTTGMLLETNSNFIPTDGCRFSFATSLGHDNFIPQNGKLVWYKKKSFTKNKYLCGIRFVEPGEYVLIKLRQRVQKGIKYIASARRVRRIANFLVILMMIGLTGYVLWEASLIYQNLNATNQRMLENSQQQALITQSYANRLDSTQMQLASVTDELEATKLLYRESQGILGDVRVELALTKAVLADTDALLNRTKADLTSSQAKLAATQDKLAGSEQKLAAVSKDLSMAKDDLLSSQTNLAGVRAGKEALADRIASIEQMSSSTRDEFQNAITLLEIKNRQLTVEMEKMQKDLVMVTAQSVKSPEEGEKLLTAYKKEINQVKSKLNHYRAEAQQIREDALIERDRIRMTLGNQGYFMKDGETVKVDYKKYQNAGLEQIKKDQPIDTVAVNSQPQSSPQAIEEVPAPPVNRKIEIDVSFVE